MTDIVFIITLCLGLIVWVEIVRDFYHILAHNWQALYRFHNWHHRVFNSNFNPVSQEIYRKAHWYNDVPEALVMMFFGTIPVIILWSFNVDYWWFAESGFFYSSFFLLGAIFRGSGLPNMDKITDLTPHPGQFSSLPAQWFINRPYHWRHHFDNQKAYYSGTLALVDKVMGTALSLKGKTVGVTGASGTLGIEILKILHLNQAKIVAFSSKNKSITLDMNGYDLPVKTLIWEVGKEHELINELLKIDILIINHGINVNSKRRIEFIKDSYEVNTFSSCRLMELFFQTIKTNRDKACKEVWINTSEAEVMPAFSPLYELSKRALGNLVTLRRLDAPCIVRKLILGPFKSKLNPIGIMSANWVAKQIIKNAKKDCRNIIVTINPVIFLIFPLKEFFQSLYFKIFTYKNSN